MIGTRAIEAGTVAPAGAVEWPAVNGPGNNHRIASSVGNDRGGDHGCCCNDRGTEAHDTSDSRSTKTDVPATRHDLCLGSRSSQAKRKGHCEGKQALLHVHRNYSLQRVGTERPVVGTWLRGPGELYPGHEPPRLSRYELRPCLVQDFELGHLRRLDVLDADLGRELLDDAQKVRS